MPITNSLPELNFKAGDYSEQLNKMAEFKRQQQQDAAVQETRDLTNQGLKKQLDPTNPLNQYAENKARSELKTQIIKDYTRDAQEWMALPDADKPAAYEKMHNTYKQYTPSMPGADAYEGDPKKMAEGVKQSLTNISNMGKDGTPAVAIITNPAWESEADTEKGVPHYLKKSGINSYDGTVKWDESKTEPYLSKWEQTMMAEQGKKDTREATAAYRGATLGQRERHFKTTEGRAAAKDAKEVTATGTWVYIGSSKDGKPMQQNSKTGIYRVAPTEAGKDPGVVMAKPSNKTTEITAFDKLYEERQKGGQVAKPQAQPAAGSTKRIPGESIAKFLKRTGG